MQPPIVYLDTQDYSRFGDVLRGKADNATEALFRALEERKEAGDAIFAVSMPILGELLQYDVGYRETTIRKAEAVERLCGSWALAFPTRLIAAEIVTEARKRNLIPNVPSIEILSSDRFWYPDISESFASLGAQIRAGIAPEVTAMNLPSRAMRRKAKKLAGKMDIAAAARDAAPQLAELYGLPVEVFTSSIVALLRNRVTPEQASRALFSVIAEPVKFVEMYFEKIETERTLPSWMSSFGRDFEGHLATFRNTLAPLLNVQSSRKQVKSLLDGRVGQLATLPFQMAADEIGTFGIDSDLRTSLAADPAVVAQLPSAQVIGAILPAYVSQIIGLEGQMAKIERSFGGDLVHALYLPHVDLWRGDRRFAAIVKNALPTYSDRIVPTPKALPDAIDAWNVQTAGQQGKK